MPPTGWRQVAHSSTVLVSHTSVGDFCGDLEQIVVPDVSVSFRHLVSVAAFRDGDFGGCLMVGEEKKMADDGAIGNFMRSECWKIAPRPDCEERARIRGFLCSLDGSWSRKEL
jgi:hypothetical protein